MTITGKEINYNLDYSQNIFVIAIDIGGSLAKVVYSPLNSNKLKFQTVETERIDKLVDLLHSIIRRHNNGDYANSRIVATGGGAFKFQELLAKEFSRLGAPIGQQDEMESLIMGLDFFIHETENEVFTYNDQDGFKVIQRVRGKFDVVNSSEDSNSNTYSSSNSIVHSDGNYPYMLVNIGSGVSILKVNGPGDFVRVGGSSLGGGTLWGLLSLITGAKTFDEMLEMAQRGDNTAVDMLVGDIYGTGYNRIGLRATNIASSFGKVFQDRRKIDRVVMLQEGGEEEEEDKEEDGALLCNGGTTKKDIEKENNDSNTTSTDQIQQQRRRQFKNQDICKSLLYAISNNIGQIAYLQARVHHVKKVYFGGSYIRGHLTTMNTLSYAIKFWSDDTKHAFFLKHEGYLGAMGAFLTLMKGKQDA